MRIPKASKENFSFGAKVRSTELLGERDAALFTAYYNVTDAGNFEGENILNVTRDLPAVAASQKVTEEQLTEALDQGRHSTVRSPGKTGEARQR